MKLSEIAEVNMEHVFRRLIMDLSRIMPKPFVQKTKLKGNKDWFVSGENDAIMADVKLVHPDTLDFIVAKIRFPASASTLVGGSVFLNKFGPQLHQVMERYKRLVADDYETKNDDHEKNLRHIIYHVSGELKR